MFKCAQITIGSFQLSRIRGDIGNHSGNEILLEHLILINYAKLENTYLQTNILSVSKF